MRSITVRIREELIDVLDDEADEHDISRSEYIRQILDSRHEADELRERVEELESRLEDRSERISELESQLAKRRDLESRVEEVALEVREDRENRNAPFFVKWARWWRDR